MRLIIALDIVALVVSGALVFRWLVQGMAS